MDKEDYSSWFSYKDEYGATISIHIPNLFIRVEKMEKSLSNINDHVNKLNNESIETNTIVKKTLKLWLEKNGERIIKEYVREFNPSEFMKMKFKQNAERIKKLEEKLLG